MLSAGAQFNLQGKEGATPLHAACITGHVGVIRALLSAGARADLLDVFGMTPQDVCHVSCAVRWSAWCKKPRRRGAAPRPMRAEWGHPQLLLLCCPLPTASQPAGCRQPVKVVVKAPTRGLVGCRLRPASSAAGLLPGVCAPCAGARHQLHLVVCPSSRRVAAVCPRATAHKSARRSIGRRAATRRRAHSCGRRGRR